MADGMILAIEGSEIDGKDCTGHARLISGII